MAKYLYKGVVDCTKTAKQYPQAAYNESVVLDLWLTADDKRVYVTKRDWTVDPEPPKPKGGELYCGEIWRRTIKTGDVELMVLDAIDHRDNPWRYAEWHFFYVNPYMKRVTEIPKRAPLTDRAWTALTRQIDNRSHINAYFDLYCASAKAFAEFSKHPELTEVMYKVGAYPILVRGHGYYGDLPKKR